MIDRLSTATGATGESCLTQDSSVEVLSVIRFNKDVRTRASSRLSSVMTGQRRSCSGSDKRSSSSDGANFRLSDHNPPCPACEAASGGSRPRARSASASRYVPWYYDLGGIILFMSSLQILFQANKFWRFFCDWDWTYRWRLR